MFCYARTRDGRVCNKTATCERIHDGNVVLRMCRTHANTYDEWLQASRDAALERILRGRAGVPIGATPC